jgi:chromosome segregation ATPase
MKKEEQRYYNWHDYKVCQNCGKQWSKVDCYIFEGFLRSNKCAITVIKEHCNTELTAKRDQLLDELSAVNNENRNIEKVLKEQNKFINELQEDLFNVTEKYAKNTKTIEKLESTIQKYTKENEEITQDRDAKNGENKKSMTFTQKHITKQIFDLVTSFTIPCDKKMQETEFKSWVKKEEKYYNVCQICGKNWPYFEFIEGVLRSSRIVKEHNTELTKKRGKLLDELSAVQDKNQTLLETIELYQLSAVNNKNQNIEMVLKNQNEHIIELEKNYDTKTQEIKDLTEKNAKTIEKLEYTIEKKESTITQYTTLNEEITQERDEKTGEIKHLKEKIDELEKVQYENTEIQTKNKVLLEQLKRSINKRNERY